MGYENLIISFEPVASTFETLKQRSEEDQNWEVFNFALGAAKSTMEINVMSNPVFSSFMTPDVSEEQSFSAQNAVERTELVQVKTLDSVMEEIADKCPAGQTYLKLDTQGYDLEVVRGAEMSLSRIMALQTEVSVKLIYKDIPNFVESYEFLAAKGFGITGMFPISWDPSLRVVEFDFVMVNGALLDEPVN